jgi:bacteriocin biosynthesis cyclodehydratase domain-containing protein
MKDDPASHFPQANSKDVPRFAPNFTVYVMPPDTVCLYSEDRKFFLHGELYCALAAAIGEGGKSFRQLVGEVGRRFPTDKVHEAFKRLLDRRYLLASSRTSGGLAAAYWASLGLSPETAQRNLQKCRVRIRSLDVEGAKELEAALRGLGVRLVKGAADLTVMLINDYLDPRLAAFNREQLADKAPWLLAQPSGIFPLVGPILRPRKSACWNCLADRMIRNREVKGMLARGNARAVAVSPLARQPVGQSGIQLAAFEIAKAIATDHRTDLGDHIVSLDLLGSAVARHYVSRRPQCPSCGRKKLRDPKRAPAPLELGGGGKVVMTSGGYRTVSPRETVARFRKHVSPLTGVISRLERIEVDLPLNASFYAAHNFSAPAFSVHELRAGLTGGSFGKGSTAEQGEASALMEAIERYSGIYQGDEIRVTKRFTDFPPGDAIAPNDVMLYSDAQLSEGQAALAAGELSHPPPPFDPNLDMEWSPVWSLRDRRFKYLPTGFLYFFYRGPGAINADSNGCAAGNTVAEAIVQGFLELVERDAYAIWWYNRLQRPAVDLAHFEDSYIRDLQAQLGEHGRRLWVLDVTNDFKIPTFVGITHWMQDGKENIEFGSGAHFDARIALLRTLTELNQFLSIGLMGGGTGEKSSLDGVTPLRLQEYPFLSPSGEASAHSGSDPKFSRLDTQKQVAACVEVAQQQGLDFMVLDQTRADIEVPVVRVVVPGMRHFYKRFAPGRLYDVPVKLGLRDRPTPEQELNQIHPHT